jgi:hypothetical protein
MKRVSLALFLILTLSCFNLPVLAAQPINKYGIHILNPDEVFQAAKLVNSTGGDWGWVTIVIREDQMEKEVVQKFFDDCRELHLVPLIRIATHMEKDYWVKPAIGDAVKWLNFLDSLNWPVQSRYLIIYNEPNQNKEWGGKTNPVEYGLILAEFIKQFKLKNPHYQILNAGFDLASPNSKTTIEVLRFWQEMDKSIPGIFEKLDGWASHSYPNHGYVGTPNQSGKISIKGYQWEQLMLKQYFKIDKKLPVFITETGWPIGGKKFLTEKTVLNYLKSAYEDYWLKDGSLMAVTPFVLSYPEPPFAEFSWLDKQGSPSAQFQMVRNLAKTSWWPMQETKYELKSIYLPPFLPTDSTYTGKLVLKNTGQSIWNEHESPIIPGLEMLTDAKTKPGETAEFKFELYSGTVSGQLSFSWGDLPEFKIWVLPSSTITRVEFSLWQKLIHLFTDFSVKLGKNLRLG